jgi:hypothetical protein
MKKPYQIEAQRAVMQLEAMANDGNPAVQLVLPMAEMVGWLRKGVGELVRQAGLQLMELLMQEEVRELVGERSQRQAERTANRWGSERGYCIVMGQKVPVKRPRVRTAASIVSRMTASSIFPAISFFVFTRAELESAVNAIAQPNTEYRTIPWKQIVLQENRWDKLPQ